MDQLKAHRNLVDVALEMGEFKGKEIPPSKLKYWEHAIMDLLRETNAHWSNDTRPAPQVHMRVQVGGQKRVPEATFTIDADIRDVTLEDYFEQRDKFQAMVDERYPLAKE